MMGTSIALLPRVPLPPRRALSAPYSEIGASHGERSYSSEQSHPAFSSFVGWCVGVTPDYHQPVCACSVDTYGDLPRGLFGCCYRGDVYRFRYLDAGSRSRV